MRKIKKALDRVKEQMRREYESHVERHKGSGPNYGVALQGEGYQAGYRDALQDCLLSLRGVQPNRNMYWSQPIAPGEPGKESDAQ